MDTPREPELNPQIAWASEGEVARQPSAALFALFAKGVVFDK